MSQQLFDIQRRTIEVEYGVVAAEASFEEEVSVARDLPIRELHLGFFGDNYDSTQAEQKFSINVAFYDNASKMFEQNFFPSTEGATDIEPTPMPGYQVLVTDPATPASQRNASMATFTSGRSPSIPADSLVWYYGHGLLLPRVSVITAPLRFSGFFNRVVVSSRPVKTSTWRPVSADGVNDGIIFVAFALVSKRL